MMSETLAREAGIHEFQCQKEPFLELNTILEALRRRDLEPALAWAADHRDLLNSQVLSKCPHPPIFPLRNKPSHPPSHSQETFSGERKNHPY